MTLLLTNEERGHYIDRAPRSKYWSDSFLSNVSHYLERNANRKNLVICYGDSWTWGDSLGNAKAALCIEDADYRAQHIYASKLADKLDADFINCAIPGIFNYWIHDRLQILVENDIERLSTQYDYIWIIVTLTESGRDFEFSKYVQDFQNFYNWESQDPEDILVQTERFDFWKLQAITTQLPKNCRLIIGRNFTDTFEENKSILLNLMPVTWTKILFEDQGIPNVTKIPLMSYGLNNFDEFVKANKLDSAKYKQWMSHKILPDVTKILDMLEQSVYNNKKASRHPNEHGHALWAEYIYNYINEQAK
jgi:hypothetical protein